MYLKNPFKIFLGTVVLFYTIGVFPDAGHTQVKTELSSHYRQWLEQDVLYIISPEERDVFLKLTTDEERDTFIEQFWARRDSDPSTPQNEFKEEHYRRIKYANEHFHAGIPGWRTDRGRIYIVYGQPDRLESHPIGGPYLRPAQEGGGQTSTFPFERWEYRHIEGIGDDIEIEFVDVSGGNLFELTTDPFKKDEFLRVPGLGMTDREMFPRPGDNPEDLRRSRVLGIRDAGSAERMGITGEWAKYSPFARTELAASLSKPPAIRFTDLKAKVEAKVIYNSIPYAIHYHAIRLSDSEALVPLVMTVPNESLTFQQADGLLNNRLQVYGRITNLGGSRVYEFDDEVLVSYPITSAQQEANVRQQQTSYRRPLALRPGRYKLETLIREDPSGHLGSATSSLIVPNLVKDSNLKTSPLVLGAQLNKLRPDQLRSPDSLLGQFKIMPNVDGSFRRDGYLAFYFEVYDYSIDPSTNAPSVSVEFAITPKSFNGTPGYRDITRSVVAAPDRLLVPRQVTLGAYDAGSYELVIRVTDRISGESVRQNAPFNVR